MKLKNKIFIIFSLTIYKKLTNDLKNKIKKFIIKNLEINIKILRFCFIIKQFFKIIYNLMIYLN